MKIRTASAFPLLILAVGLSGPVFGANCTETNIEIESQSDIDNFQVLYGGGDTCDTVVGNLLINNVLDTSIWTSLTDLNGLSDLRTIGGHLEINNIQQGGERLLQDRLEGCEFLPVVLHKTLESARVSR